MKHYLTHNMNLDNIPKDIKKNSRFCFWKSISNTDSTKKPIKKPYGFCKKTNKFIPSLKKAEYWTSWKEILNIIPHLSREWGVGLILNDGPYAVIDIDSCIQKYEKDNLKLVDGTKGILELFGGAYIEISPSLRGLHIIFRGEWLYKQHKGLRHLDQKSNSGTIEVYSGKDCRFITLTGLVFNEHYSYDKLASLSFENEMRFLFFKYFDFTKNFVEVPPEVTLSHSEDLLSTLNKNTENEKLASFENIFLSIKQKIQNSPYSDEYELLCNSNPGIYKSVSEADWLFCLFVLKFFTYDQAQNTEILKKFLLSERPYREKLDRKDYTERTAFNAILKIKEDNLIGSLLKSRAPSLKKVQKDNILRLCNQMYIFHLGRQIEDKSKEIIINNNSNNYLKANIIKNLNSKDCDYYIQILEQSANKIRQENIQLEDLTDKHLAIEINIQQVLENLCLSIGGKTYKDFMASLDKIASVTIRQRKKINTNDKILQYRGNLLSYLYTKDSKQKKLIVYLNLLTVEILMQGRYNYSLFNLESYRSLNDHRLRFLYYYFCLKTIPGGHPVKFTLDQLLASLWLESKSKEAIKQRRRTLISLLDTLEKKNENIHDIHFHLIRDSGKITAISVKKRKMLII